MAATGQTGAMTGKGAGWWSSLDTWTATLAEHPQRLFVVLALFLGLQISSLWYVTNDSCAYLSIARSLWTDTGPTSLGRSHLFYSLGYPALVTLTFFFAERPFLELAILHWGLALLLMVGVYRWARPLGAPAALYCMALTVVSAGFGIHYRRPLSELAFMTSFVWTVLALDRVLLAASLRGLLGGTVFGTLLLSFTCLLRPNGIMLAPGFGMAMLMAAYHGTRTWTAAIATTLVVGGTASAVLLGSRAWDDRRAATVHAPTYWDYLVKLQDPESSVLGRIPEGVRLQMADLQRLAIPGMLKAAARKGEWFHVNTAISLAVTALLALGWWRLLRRSPGVFPWAVPFVLGLNIVWAGDASTRYTVPLLPVGIASAWLALELRDVRGRAGLEKVQTSFASAARYSPLFWLALLVSHAGASLGYWLSVDRPRTLAVNACWPAVDALCEKIPLECHRLATWRVSMEMRQLIAFTLDRDVLWLEEKPLLEDPDAVWIVTPHADSPPSLAEVSQSPRCRYDLYFQTGDFCLWRPEPSPNRRTLTNSASGK